MKVIVTGGRDITDYATVCDAIERSGFDVTEIVSGAARGVDALGERWALERRVRVTRFPADWSTHRRFAGPYRNHEMAEYADALVLVWDGKSKGSADMLRQAQGRGLPIFEAVVSASGG